MSRPKRNCSVDGCDRKHVAHGYCGTHLYRVRKHGSTDKPVQRRSQESIAKQRQTLKQMAAEGTWQSPTRPGPNPRKGHKGARNHRWRPVGTKRTESNGYVRIKTADPSAWAWEHRWVIEQQLGRPLRTDEHVHHLNRDKADNRLENLLLMDAVAHCKLSSHQRPRYPKCDHCGYCHPPHA